MSYVLSGHFGQTSERVEDIPDDELATMCSKQKGQGGLLNTVAQAVVDTIDQDPCVELALREKIAINAKKYGIPAIGAIAMVAFMGGMLGAWVLKGARR